MSNIKEGIAFEREFCELLGSRGFWVHRLSQNAAGQQPADVIAIKDGYHTLIDCKLCSTKNGFRFSRAEDNQRNAMALFEKRGWHSCWFALKLPDGQIRMLKHSWIPVYEKLGWKGISPTDMESLTMTFEQWLEQIKNEDNDFKHDQDTES